MADDSSARPRSSTTSAASTVSTIPATAWLTPERVAHAEFRTGFRGLDATEVRAFLARVASELRAVLEREAELGVRLEQAEARSTAAVAAPLDVKQVSELLGQETARVLETARSAAADIRARAEAEATATREAAEAAAEALRTAAETVLAERTAEAEAAAAEIMATANDASARLVAQAEEDAAGHRQRALDEAEQIRAEARALREQAEADGNAAREAARDEGRRMVAEARAVRERILTDMARRRNVARQQLERVRAARETLLDAIDEVRRNVTDAHAGLSGSLVDAKLAGDRGARTVDVDDIPSVRDLDAEVEMAKDAGLIDVAALDTRDEDLSVVDTGEFAAVTAPEPEVDRSTEHAEAPDGSALAVEPAAVEPVAVAPAGSPAPEPPAPEPAAAEEPVAEHPVVEPTDGAGETPAQPAEPVVEPAGEPAAGATPAVDRPRPAKRARGAKRTDELFARLKAADDPLLAGPAATTGDEGEGSSLAGTALDAGEADRPSGGAGPDTTDADADADADAAAAADAGEAEPASNGGDRVALHTRDVLLAGTMRDLARQLKLALSDQQNQLLESGRSVAAAQPLSAEEMTPPYVTASRESLAAAFALGRRSVDPDDRAEVDPAALTDRAVSLAGAVVDSLRQRFGSGADDEGLWTETRVRSVFREVRSQRLGELVEFHVLAAYSAGQLAAAPAGSLARWVSDSCGPDCLDNALAGAVPFGEPFPTGHQAPPAFPGCRCALVVAVAD